MRVVWRALIVCGCLVGCLVCTTPVLGVQPKKLIQYGWGVPDTQYVRDHWRQIEELPLDGVGIVVALDREAWRNGDTTTTNQLGWQIMGARKFHTAEFREAIADLRAARWHTCTENFLAVALSAAQSAADVDWLNDERWRVIAQNFAVVTHIAAEGGAKGLLLDPEHYNHNLFSFLAQRGNQPFVVYEKAARRRGRQVMRAIAAALPDVRLLSLYGHTLPLSEVQSGVPLDRAAYGLLPAFYDGLLEAMPANARLIDGYEFSYSFKERGQFTRAYQRIHEAGITVSAVPRHYREKVSAGFGLWLDYRRQPNYFTAEELQRAVTAALEVSDGYVWIYSQGPRFFPPNGIPVAHLKALAAARQAAGK
jgi:hypothetical protein